MSSLDSVLADLREKREQLARDLARADAAIAALTGESGADGQASTPVTDRIVELFESYPDRRFTAETALDTLRLEGWESPAADPVNAMRTALSRLYRKKIITRVDRGEYKLAVHEDPWDAHKDPWEQTTIADGAWPKSAKEPPF